MNVRRERVVQPAVMLTEVAVCFVAAGQRFVVRYRLRVRSTPCESHADLLSSPLTRAQLEAESDGPELADFLIAHPGFWWRLPLPHQVEEGHGV